MDTDDPTAAATPSVRFDAALVSRYDGRGPRYTSYPTALQFEERFTAARYSNLARKSNATGRPLSLYVHIPFCRSLCYYCGCNKVVTRNADRVRRYLECLREEIRMQAPLFDTARTVEQLHFGGGTPTYLEDGQLADIMEWLSADFRLAGGEREFSIEIDPRSTHDETIDRLAELGFNRVSLGIQDFDADVQRAVNRIQSPTDVVRLVEDARRCGYRSVSFDLIYGLPRQSVASFDRTLDLVIDMQPDRLAVYNYAHLPERFKGQRMIREADLPSPRQKLDILKHSIEKLIDGGYVYIGMDHFALPRDGLVRAKADGTLKRNFQGYSTHGGCDLVSLGVSAISNIGTSYAQNAVSTIEYEQLIAAGSLPIKKGLVVDADDQIRAAAIHDIMCHDGVDMHAFGERHGVDFHDYFASELARLEPLLDDGLVELTADRIQVTPQGRLLLRNVAMVFDRYLSAGQSDRRFSRAI